MIMGWMLLAPIVLVLMVLSLSLHGLKGSDGLSPLGLLRIQYISQS